MSTASAPGRSAPRGLLARMSRPWFGAGAAPLAVPGRAPSGSLDAASAPASPSSAGPRPLSPDPHPLSPDPRPLSSGPRPLSSDPRTPVEPRLDALAATAGERGGLAGATFSAADLAGLRARAAGLSLDTPRPSRGGRSSVRASRLRGRGMEYSESRIYLPGDDIRSIDWRVTARTGRTHTKLFHEERERPVFFVVDLGEHMRFGTRRAFKSVVAAEAASLLAWAAVANGDRAGGFVFAGGHTVESRVAGGRRGALGLIRALVEIENDAPARDVGDGIGDAMARARRLARPGALVVVISDFSALEDSAGQQLVRLREHGDLLCVQVYDRLESTSPPPARYPVGDGRRTTILDARASEIARAIERRFDRIETRLAAACRRAGAALVRIRCGADVRAALRGTPAGRAGRAGRP